MSYNNPVNFLKGTNTNAQAITISGNFTTTVTVTGNTAVTLPTSGILATLLPRVVAMADATSFTPTGATADINTQTNTQAGGTLTANAPSGSPANGQGIEIVIKSTNVQIFSWNAIYTGCTTTVLPTATTGSGKTDKLWFQYNSLSSKWELYNAQYGYA